MDRIFIQDLKVNTRVGVYPEEQQRKQGVSIDLELSLDLSRAAVSDALEDTVDYSAIEDAVVNLAENTPFQLIEHLAGAIGQRILADHPEIREILVRVRKPRSARFARTLGVEIHLTQSHRK